ncbi:MAG: extracellular solute-binding protein [Halanaerobiales bacterium]
MKKNLTLLCLVIAVSIVLSSAVFAQVTLTLWDIRTESDPVSEPMADAIARFEADYPDVKIQHVPIQNDNYKTKIQTAMAANNEPDIFMTWGSSSLEKYVDNDKVLDLTPYLTEDWQANFTPAAMDLGIINGQQYGIPVTNMATAVIWYRTDLFEKYDLEVPETYEELMDVCMTLKINGITPFTLANKTKWTGSMYFVYLADRIGGPEAFRNAANRTGAFNDEAFIEVGRVIQDMVKRGYFPEGVNGMDEDTGQSRALIYADKAAMYLMGTWANGVFESENPEMKEDNISFFNFPAFQDGKGDPTNLIGTPGDNYYSVAASSDNKEMAVEFLKYISDSDFASDLAQVGNLPPFTGVKDDIEDPTIQEVYELFQDANHIQLWYDQSLPQELATVHLNTTQALFGLTMTPEEAANAMEEAAQEYYGE